MAVGHGLKAARQLSEQVQAGTSPYAFIEIMACPGGCMGGGGQPRIKGSYQIYAETRQAAIYDHDRNLPIRQSHNNPLLQKLYKDFLGEPLSHKSHELLHTYYTDRKRQIKHTIKAIWEEIKIGA